jgi:hypothetical protein
MRLWDPNIEKRGKIEKPAYPNIVIFLNSLGLKVIEINFTSIEFTFFSETDSLEFENSVDKKSFHKLSPLFSALNYFYYRRYGYGIFKIDIGFSDTSIFIYSSTGNQVNHYGYKNNSKEINAPKSALNSILREFDDFDTYLIKYK